MSEQAASPIAGQFIPRTAGVTVIDGRDHHSEHKVQVAAIPQVPQHEPRLGHLVRARGVPGQHFAYRVVVPAQTDLAAFAVGQDVLDHARERPAPGRVARVGQRSESCAVELTCGPTQRTISDCVSKNYQIVA